MALFRLQRLWLNLAIGLSILTLPWWISVVLVIGLLFAARSYEVMVWGVLFDMLYGVAVPSFFNIPLFFTILFTLLFIVTEYSKRFLIFY